jgi:RNA polymerase sigma-70 factor (ECF subfamily)
MSIEEQEAIRRVKAGDQDAFRFLMDRHLPAILRLAMNITRNILDAEEAAQEAFFLAYKKLPSFREDSVFGTWVYRIAVNCSLNLVKRRSRNLGWNAQPLELSSSGDETVASTLPSPEAEFLQNESLVSRQQALLALTPMERTAFLLRHMEDESMDTIAKTLGISINSAKQAVFRAVIKLRKQLVPTGSHSSSGPTQTHLAKETR